MKTNQGVKTLIVVLVLAIVGLTTFIAVDKIILNKGTETEKKQEGQNLTTGNVNSNDEQKNVVENNNTDYSKYIGHWVSNETQDELTIKSIENNKMTFEWMIYRTGVLSERTMNLVNNNVEFYYEGYQDENFDNQITENERTKKKIIVELTSDAILINVEEVKDIPVGATKVNDNDMPGYYLKGTRSFKINNNKNITGLYEFKTKTKEDNNDIGIDLGLYENGEYIYTCYIGAPHGTMGTYTVSGNTVVLTAKYETASDPSLGIYKNPEKIVLYINSDGTISDKEASSFNENLKAVEVIDKVDYKNIVLKKSADGEENRLLGQYKSVTEMVNSRPEEYKYFIDEPADGNMIGIEQEFTKKLVNSSNNSEKLLDYRIDNIKILTGSERQELLNKGYKETDTLALVTFSVKPQNVNTSNWRAGNGEVSGDWIINKQACECMRDGELLNKTDFNTGW